MIIRETSWTLTPEISLLLRHSRFYCEKSGFTVVWLLVLPFGSTAAGSLSVGRVDFVR